MSIQAIALLVVAGAIHSMWNLLLKRSQDKQVFLWLAMAMTAVIFFIPFVLLYTPVSGHGWLLILLSGALESTYLLLLGGAYQRGDLSLVYPLARGSAIMFVTLLAPLFIGERIASLGFVGVALIALGMYVVNLRGLGWSDLRAPLVSLRERPSQLALLTGLSIAGYSLVDKIGVRYVPPEEYVYLIMAASVLWIAPYMLTVRRPTVISEWRDYKWQIIAVGVMSPATYLLVLFAMTRAQVSYVSSVREVSIIFAALLGTYWLRESFGKQKLAGALLIFAGIACVGLAR